MAQRHEHDDHQQRYFHHAVDHCRPEQRLDQVEADEVDTDAEECGHCDHSVERLGVKQLAVEAGGPAERAGAGTGEDWRILAETGLTPRQLEPGAFRTLPEYGIGLTDMVKAASGSDAQLPLDANDVVGFIARIRLVRPRLVAFNGKRAAAVFYGRPSAALGYGLGAPCADFPPVWVLPSTSGAASGAWSEQPWRSLAQAVLARR